MTIILLLSLPVHICFAKFFLFGWLVGLDFFKQKFLKKNLNIVKSFAWEGTPSLHKKPASQVLIGHVPPKNAYYRQSEVICWAIIGF